MAELSEAELHELAEQAVVGAYRDDEQMTGIYTMIEDSPALPFTTTVPGVEANADGVELTDSEIAATCLRGAHRQAIPILPLPVPPRQRP